MSSCRRYSDTPGLFIVQGVLGLLAKHSAHLWSLSREQSRIKQLISLSLLIPWLSDGWKSKKAFYLAMTSCCLNYMVFLSFLTASVSMCHDKRRTRSGANTPTAMMYIKNRFVYCYDGLAWTGSRMKGTPCIQGCLYILHLCCCHLVREARCVVNTSWSRLALVCDPFSGFKAKPTI